MSATESPSSPGHETRDAHYTHEPTETPAASTDLPTQTEDDHSQTDSSQTAEMNAQVTTEPSADVTPPNSAPMNQTITTPSSAEQQPLVGQMERLSVSGTTTPNDPVSSANTSPGPPPPEKDDVYLNLNAAPTTSMPTLPPINTNRAPSPEKELPDVPGDSDAESKRENQTGGPREDTPSQPEIQSIMGQFQDPARSTDQREIMSPRLELAEQFRGGSTYFPPRRSSLDHANTSGSADSPIATSPQKQPVPQHPHKPDSPVSNRRASTSTLLPPPEPESDQPFDFHRFLEQLRHRTADPVAKFLRSFLLEFGKKQWMVHEQVKIISDFLTFITNKMAMCEIWRDVSDSEFDNAKEGMEKLVMNRLYSQTFSPAIPAPPTIPRSASRSRRRELERLHGPWRRGQHQEDIERDDILAQKIRIYGWVNETHLDIPTVSSGGRRFLNLAQQGTYSHEYFAQGV
jgi:hypothetical protein